MLPMLAFLLSLTTYVFPPVLMYHRVDVDVPRNGISRDLTITPQTLDAQLNYLRSQGLTPISMDEFERRYRAKKPTDRDVIVTFDDGYSDQYRYAFPVLERDRAGATFYIVTHNVGRDAHVTWPELKFMLAHRMDIEAHGESHDDLAGMTDSRQRTEIDGSIGELENRLKLKSVSSYAYPSGRFNLETLRIERAAGVPVAVTTDARNIIQPQDALQVVRIRVRRAWTLEDFASAVRRALERPQVLQR
jgi:peptidoglycan/xylan/chitin deacetylase (PgdA/CDA1 family)